MTMKVLILSLSPQDLLTVKNEWYPDHKTSSALVYFLSNTVVHYNIRINQGRIPATQGKKRECVNQCSERWHALREQQTSIGEVFLGALHDLPPDLTRRLVNEADLKDAN